MNVSFFLNVMTKLNSININIFMNIDTFMSFMIIFGFRIDAERLTILELLQVKISPRKGEEGLGHSLAF